MSMSYVFETISKFSHESSRFPFRYMILIKFYHFEWTVRIYLCGDRAGGSYAVRNHHLNHGCEGKCLMKFELWALKEMVKQCNRFPFVDQNRPLYRKYHSSHLLHSHSSSKIFNLEIILERKLHSTQMMQKIPKLIYIHDIKSNKSSLTSDQWSNIELYQSHEPKRISCVLFNQFQF